MDYPMLLYPGKGLVLPNHNIDQIATYCRFLILSIPNNDMTRKSPFAIQKAIQGIGGELKSVKKVRSEARKLIAPQLSQTYAQTAKFSPISAAAQTDENITKIKCPPLNLLQPLSCPPKPNILQSTPAVTLSSSSTQAKLLPSTSSITATVSEPQPPTPVSDVILSSANTIITPTEPSSSIVSASTSVPDVLPELALAPKNLKLKPCQSAGGTSLRCPRRDTVVGLVLPIRDVGFTRWILALMLYHYILGVLQFQHRLLPIKHTYYLPLLQCQSLSQLFLHLIQFLADQAIVKKSRKRLLPKYNETGTSFLQISKSNIPTKFASDAVKKFSTQKLPLIPRRKKRPSKTICKDIEKKMIPYKPKKSTPVHDTSDEEDMFEEEEMNHRILTPSRNGK
ncbi:hypothetical protein TNCV_3514171 [Trichonephila clavipes]|nr:hypothetical protein TNCV_3514171 [Trichonephila clavipes]